ncbi:hypothetical protein IVA78_29205 [Bradyrhizobium sp. 137]|uniref:hypothetical protein n=1 Tax=Bradyrhizobium sp. 137 TaxID=2782614 RepID=UPI001FFB57DF|nr:hypothetical protein [Bradyrhizobium sp. 137]MCK1759123.1 hypothetical protein [Bradyrhizobium sp. 137]
MRSSLAISTSWRTGWMMSAESITHLILAAAIAAAIAPGQMTPSSASSITALNDAELNALH